jgi:hypothetical protein
MFVFRPAFLVLTGCALLVGGFLWFAIFAGIPYQDASPEQAAAYKFHNDNSFRMQLAGLLLLAVVSVWGVSRWALALWARRQPGRQPGREPVDRGRSSSGASAKQNKLMRKNRK